MTRSWWVRFAFLAVLILISIGSFVPTLSSKDMPHWYSKKINLGLDLQGGLYMVLGIDFNKVYRDEMANYAKKMETFLKEQKVEITLGELSLKDITDPHHTFVVTDPTQVSLAKSKIEEFFAYPLRLVGEEKNILTYALGREYKREIENTAVSKSIEVIRNRIDEFGVTEPEIVSQGQDRIVVQLPGVKDIERAKELIGKTAKLEFRFANDEVSEAQMNDWIKKAETGGVVFKKGERFSDYVTALNTFLQAELPKGFSLFFAKELSKLSNETTKLTPYILESAASLTGDELQEAFVRVDQQNNKPYVAITFKAAGAKIFEAITAKNVGRRMAIVLDGNVYSAPVIQERIAGGSAQISLGFGDYNKLMTEARDLALVLRAGALPVELDFQEQRIVGPSLGADAIVKAELAAVVGSFLVFLFVTIYYRVSGLIASVTVICNVLMTLACLILLEATLTLPGIAGIALTVGMAIDGNIIIYERIREELVKGAKGKQAAHIGFDKAFWTILDANITTAIAGLCLLNFGTGPVRGFAVTLLIGIAATVYTSYFVSKVLYDLYVGKERDTLSI